jgi:hypothetical protein
MGLTDSISEEQASRPSFLADKLTTIREMLASLDTLTFAGQRHLMTKVIAFVDPQVHRVIDHAPPGERGRLLEELSFLRRESDRQLPSVPAFGERAAGLLALLGDGA